MNPPYLGLYCLLALMLGTSIGQMGHAEVSPAILTAPALAQQPDQTPLCDPAFVDGTFTFADQPAGEQTVSLHFQNESTSACRLRGAVGSSFAVDGHSMTVENCWLCDATGKPSMYPDGKPGNQIRLEPGGRAALDLQWTSMGKSCQWADWVDFQFWWMPPPNDARKITSYLFVPSGWPLHICSPVKSSGYRAETAPSTGDASDGVLRITVLQATVYSDERATLHAEIVGHTKRGTKPTGCGTLFTVHHEPAGATRLDPLPVSGGVWWNSYTPEQILEDKERAWPSWKKDFRRRCEIVRENESVDAEIAAAELTNLTHIEWRTAPRPGEAPIFLTATTHFSVTDVDTLAPNWGETVRGIRAGLSVDRTSFKAGERVSLHLRWEDVNADVPLAEGECKEPPGLVIQDSEHYVIKTIQVGRGCMGHGWGPFEIQKGKAQHKFFELKNPPPQVPPWNPINSDDLQGPGVYYLVSVWSPHVLDRPDPATSELFGTQHAGRFGSFYATARSLPVRIEIVP